MKLAWWFPLASELPALPPSPIEAPMLLDLTQYIGETTAYDKHTAHHPRTEILHALLTNAFAEKQNHSV